MTSRAAQPLLWRELHWQRPLDPVRVSGLLRQWATDPRSPLLVLETRASSQGVRNLLGGEPPVVRSATELLEAGLPGSQALPLDQAERRPVDTATRLRSSSRHRPLRIDDPLFAVRALASALASVRSQEQLVVQVLLGPRRVPLAIPSNSPSSLVSPWWQIALYGNGKTIDSEKRRALRSKVSDHGFACTIRLGVTAASPGRRRNLLLGVLAAIRTAESAGVQLQLSADNAGKLQRASRPLRWPLRLNVQELVSLLGWPLGGDDLPGYAAVHPRRLPPAPGTAVAARALALSDVRPATPLGLSAADALHHLHVVGPTGTGKSTLLANLILQDIQAGRGVVVIEPKGDLVADVLARIPDQRRGDVVILDPSDTAPVGLNPLAPGRGIRPELVADAVLTIFKQLYGSAIGPRSADILHAGLLTLAMRPDASLVMLPLLLTNPGFRRSLTATLNDPIALGPFWEAFDSWSEAERQAAVAPVMNKLRPLLRPGVRAVLGQRQPRFDVRQVFTERRILLVPLRRAALGPEAAALIGSLVVSRLWQTTLARADVDPARRHPVMVYIDEVQDFLHLPTDLGDALAQARGLGVGFTLAHQYLSQLSTEMRAGVLANARSRVCFQLPHDDATVLAKGHPELEPADLTSLAEYSVYASLFSRGVVTPYASGRTQPLPSAAADVAALRYASRRAFGRPLDDIEAGFAALLAPPAADLGATGRRRRTAS